MYLGVSLAGKSIYIPQWLHDHGDLPIGDYGQKLPVAVLVPRRAVAESIATYVSKMRSCNLGDEVGLGVMGNAAYKLHSSGIVFMTYDYFAQSTKGSQHFADWGAVVLDEAHERTQTADLLVVQMAAACLARPKFRAVLLSASFDTYNASLYDGLFRPAQGSPLSRHRWILDQRSFPATHSISDVWTDEVWDSIAMSDLVREIVWIATCQATDGHVLVFVL